MEQFVKEHKTESKFLWSLMRDDVHDALIPALSCQSKQVLIKDQVIFRISVILPPGSNVV